MTDSSSTFPSSGNPMRPILILMAGFFLLMLIVFPVGMVLGGVGTGGTIGVTILIIVVAVGCLAFCWRLGQAYEQDHVQLIEGEPWASWTLSPTEHRRFLADERKRSLLLAVAYALGGGLLGVFFMTVVGDMLTGAILLGAFLFAAIIIVAVGGPPWRSTEAARQVRIGPRGVRVLGGYLPLQGTGIKVTRVELRSGDPAILRFTVRTGRRLQDIRVPVPSGRMADAQEIVDRFGSEDA